MALEGEIFLMKWILLIATIMIFIGAAVTLNDYNIDESQAEEIARKRIDDGNSMIRSNCGSSWQWSIEIDNYIVNLNRRGTRICVERME
jgi:hypothetical protein